MAFFFFFFGVAAELELIKIVWPFDLQMGLRKLCSGLEAVCIEIGRL